MLRPSYTELMEILNETSGVDSKITSRYTIVIAVAKRARQLIDGADPLTYAPTDRAVSTAVKEISEGMINIRFTEDANYNMKSSGLAYTDYADEMYQSKKPISYAMDKSDREIDILEYDDDHESDYDHDDDRIGFDSTDEPYDEANIEADIELSEDMDQDYQDEDQ